MKHFYGISVFLTFLFICLGKGTQAAEYYLIPEGYEAAGTYNGKPLYLFINPEKLTVECYTEGVSLPGEEPKFVPARFNLIYLNGEKFWETALQGPGGVTVGHYVERAELNLSNVSGSTPNLLQAKSDDTDRGSFYFINIDNEYTFEGIIFSIGPDFNATVIGLAESKQDLMIPSSFKLGNIDVNVVEIGNEAFKNNVSLQSVSIPGSVTLISSNAFNGCSSLKTVIFEASKEALKISAATLSNSLFSDSPLIKTTIYRTLNYEGNSPFMGKTTLTEVVFGENFTQINAAMFKDCSGLKTLNIPESVRYIRQNAFEGCTSLQRVDAKDLLSWLGISFSNMMSNPLYYGGDLYLGGKEMSSLDFPTPDFADYDVYYIPDYAFYGCKSLKKVNFVQPVFMGVSAFANCTNLEYLKFTTPSDLSLLKNQFPSLSIFENCTKLINYEINRYQTSININFKAFKIDFVDLQGKTIPATVEMKGAVKNTQEITDGKSVTFRQLFPDYLYEFLLMGYLELGEARTLPLVAYINVKDIYADSFFASANWQLGNAELIGADLYDGLTTYRDIKSNKNYHFEVDVEETSTQNYVTLAIRYEPSDPKTHTASQRFTVPGVKWENEKAVATSVTSARISAQVNLSNYCTTAGIEWRRYDAPEVVPSTVVLCPIIDGYLLGSLHGLSNEKDVYYQYRPFVKNSYGKTIYGGWVGFYTSDANVYFEPEIVTFIPVVEDGSVQLSGYALPGTEEIISQGFQYRRDQTRASDWIQLETGDGIRMNATLNNLSDAVYEMRTYAVTSKGSYYGNIETFEIGGEAGIYEISDDESQEIIPENSSMDIFTLQGIIVKRNAKPDDLKPLSPGFYIIGGKKILIK